MCYFAAIPAALAGLSAASQARSDRNQLEYQEDIERNNQTLEEFKQQDAVKRGEEAIQDRLLETAQTRGKTRTSLAARGLSLESGSALSILDDVEYISNIDTSRIKQNSLREAWGYEVSAQNRGTQADLFSQQAAGINPATEGLLAFGGNLSSGFANRG